MCLHFLQTLWDLLSSPPSDLLTLALTVAATFDPGLPGFPGPPRCLPSLSPLCEGGPAYCSAEPHLMGQIPTPQS